MDQKTVWWGIGIVVVVIIIILFVYQRGSQPTIPTDTNGSAEAAVTETVTDFGNNLSMVSLLAPANDVGIAMEENYAQYVAPELLAKWESDPAHAPGRTTSSPAPDHIEVLSAQANADGSYTVLANVIETTGTGTASTTNAGTYAVTVRLENRDGAWLITGFEGYPPQA